MFRRVGWFEFVLGPAEIAAADGGSVFLERARVEAQIARQQGDRLLESGRVAGDFVFPPVLIEIAGDLSTGPKFAA